MKKVPFGVTVVTVLTLLGAIGDFFFAVVWIAFGGIGSAGVYVSPPISYWIVLFNSLLLSIIALVALIGIFQRARYA